MSDLLVRPGQRRDLPQVMGLIRELAVYEKGLDQVSNTVEAMDRDGFGENPLFGFFVAESSGSVIGLSLYYYRYSTWKGKRLYLEDIVVSEKFRGKGAGKKLFEVTIQKAKDEECTGMMWQVLDWNEPAINFYKKHQAKFDANWMNCNIDFD